jgi:hypothetical protein
MNRTEVKADSGRSDDGCYDNGPEFLVTSLISNIQSEKKYALKLSGV